MGILTRGLFDFPRWLDSALRNGGYRKAFEEHINNEFDGYPNNDNGYGKYETFDKEDYWEEKFEKVSSKICCSF